MYKYIVQYVMTIITTCIYKTLKYKQLLRYKNKYFFQNIYIFFFLQLCLIIVNEWYFSCSEANPSMILFK